MHDFYCKSADDMNSDVLAKKVRELKETQKGVDSMCRELEELYNNGVEFGIGIGESRGEKKRRNTWTTSCEYKIHKKCYC